MQINRGGASYLHSGHELLLDTRTFSAILVGTLQLGASLRFCIKGSSMFPLIRHKDLISVSPIKDVIRIGDIVAFNSDENRIVVHRLLTKRGGKIVLKGDFMERGRIETVEENRILGRVTRIDRNGKRILLGLGKGRVLIAYLSRHCLLRPLSCFYSKACIFHRHYLLRKSV